MTVRGLSLRALRSRRAQSILLLALSIVAIAACAAGPLYERAVEQAAVRSQLAGVGTADRGVTIQGSTAAETASYLPSGADARLFGRPVAGVETTVAVQAPPADFQAPVAGRDDICGHLTITSGVGRDGSLQLPPNVRDQIPPGTLLRVHLNPDGTVLLDPRGGGAQ